MIENFHIISGCSGGGKSTVLAELGRRGHTIVPEAGRLLVQEQQAIGGIAGPGTELFVHLLLSRSMYLYNLAVAARHPGHVFFDRSIIEPVCHWRHLGQMAPHLEVAARRFRYAPDVFMAPPWPEIYVNDPERTHEFEAGRLEFDLLQEAYPFFGYRLIELPKVSVKERADFIEQHVSS